MLTNITISIGINTELYQEFPDLETMMYIMIRMMLMIIELSYLHPSGDYTEKLGQPIFHCKKQRHCYDCF